MNIETIINISVAALMLISALVTLIAALGLVFQKDFFARTHPPVLAYTMGAWCISLAALIYFSFISGQLKLHTLLIILLLAVTAPVSSILITRTALFRARRSGQGHLYPQPLKVKNASVIEKD